MDEERLRNLLDAYVDDALSQAEKAELEQMFLRHPWAREQFWQHVGFHALLREHAEQSWAADVPFPGSSAKAVDDVFGGVEPVSSSSVPSRLPLAPALWMLPGALVGVLIAALVWHYWSGGSSLESVQPQAIVESDEPASSTDEEPTTDTVAIMTRAIEAQWSGMELPTKIGSPLSAGTVRLQSGLVQLEFYSGATIVIEGPAELRLDSATEASLIRGRLRAEVPPPASGFRVRCPAIDVVDLGTEFGISVGPEKDAEVHVFDGVVRLFEPGRAGVGNPRYELTTGCGVRIDSLGELQDIPADPGVFQDPARLTRSAEALREMWVREWEEHCRTIDADPRLICHFAFDAQDSWERAVSNTAANGPADSDGAVVGCDWTEGRWQGKRALQFASISDRVRFRVPGKFETLTLVASIRVDALENQYNAIMMCDDFEAGELHWQISQKGTMALGVQGTEGRPGYTYRTPPVFRPDMCGLWMHLAVVIDPAAGYVAQYVDGEEIAREEWRSDLPLAIGAAELGNWGVYRHRTGTPIRGLTGRMDQFMIFQAALSPDEIQRLSQRFQPAY